MNEAFENLPVVKNIENRHFELEVEGHKAFIDYKQRGNKIWLTHTESPAALAGKGVATALIEKTLTSLKENNQILVPLCPLVVAYIKRHPEWVTIVAEDYRKPFAH